MTVECNAEEIDTLPKCAVILGAGASAGVSNDRDVKESDWRPPLAKELFDMKAKPTFRDHLLRWPGANALAAMLGPLATKRDFDLERELARFAVHQDETVRQQFRHVPLYIHEVVAECSRRFVTSPSNYMWLVHELCLNRPHHVAFLTLNYDTLLETALDLQHASWWLPVRSLEDYVSAARRAKVIKLHGSVDWAVSLPREATSWESAVLSLDLSQPLGPIRFKGQSQWNVGSPNWFQDREYPALTAPLAGKTTATALVCPEQHRDWATQFLRGCAKFLVIGTSGHDDDLFELLRDSIPSRCRLVHYVSRGDAEDVARRFSIKVPRLMPIHPDHVFPHGFQGYLHSALFRAFVDAPG